MLYLTGCVSDHQPAGDISSVSTADHDITDSTTGPVDDVTSGTTAVRGVTNRTTINCSRSGPRDKITFANRTSEPLSHRIKSSFDVGSERVRTVSSNAHSHLSDVEPDSDEVSDQHDENYDSSEEYLPPDCEMLRKCNMCEEDVFIACPDPSCLSYLCYDHRMTSCSEHKETALSSSRSKMLEMINVDFSSTDDDESTGNRRHIKAKKVVI